MNKLVNSIIEVNRAAILAIALAELDEMDRTNRGKTYAFGNSKKLNKKRIDRALELYERSL